MELADHAGEAGREAERESKGGQLRGTLLSIVRIAVVGSGISGLTCAHVLGPHHDVVLFEADDRLGGHSNTVEVEDPTAGPIGIDTGFIVHNDRNYPNLVRLFDELGLETVDSEMSFAVTDRATGLCYRATSPNTLFADRRRLLDRSMWRMLADITRFYRNGRRLLAAVESDGGTNAETPTIGQFLADGGYSQVFIDHHLIPMGASVWSAEPEQFNLFPATTLLRFLDNHGLLSVGDRPMWRTLRGGSRTYVKAVADRFDGEIRLSQPVTAIRRLTDGGAVDGGAVDGGAVNGSAVEVTTDDGVEQFDHVILAAHSDQSLAALSDPTEAEKRYLSAVRYQPNRATLHFDDTVMPPKRLAWAAWNYDQDPANTSAALTYDLTLLMRLDGSRRYFVSLNSDDRINQAKVLASFDYAHPVFDHPAIEAQSALAAANGTQNTWFCGAWMGYGFHEDGMASGLAVCRSLGVDW